MLGERMEREIREQPEVLARGAREYWSPLLRAVSDRKLDLVLLAARGSSDNAALYARYLIEVHVGLPVSLAAPSVLTRYGRRVRYKRCFGVGISQSGAAPDVAEVLSSLRDEGHFTLGITNTPGSRLTREAEFTLLLNAGEERSVAATKTYTSSLLALYLTTRAMDAHLPDPASLLPDSAWVETARSSAQEAAQALLASDGPLFALGRGYGFSTAQETALKLMECALLPCKSYSSADFEHGPKALAGPGSVAISFDGPKPDLAAQGCRIVEAPVAPVPEEIRPLWDVIFGQRLALDAARARGLDPDDPQHIQKVTETL
jgi:glucosamine--fructose-6-phosphate aminotransferase (isomerizing)